MAFLNETLLVGLAAVAAPIAIHLLSRRRARVVYWGAMRFLVGPAAARGRRVMLEEVALMVLRCLLVALAALAVARPFLSGRAAVPWELVLPAFVAAVVCVAAAAVAWHHRRAVLALLAFAATVPALAGGVWAAGHFLRTSPSPPQADGRDIAIIIDGSSSMALRPGGRANFEVATGEAAGILDACTPSDTVSLFVAGAVPRELTPGAISDRKQLRDLLQTARPIGGSMNLPRAIEAAAGSLAKGRSAARMIVLLTDGQDLGRALGGKESRRALAASLRRISPKAPIRIICRRLPVPSQFANAAVEDITFSDKLIALGRPVRIEAAVANLGTKPLPASRLELRVEGASDVLAEGIEEMPAGSSRSASFEYRFRKPGSHVVTATLVADDDLPDDNTAVRVVDVVERLPVLVVDGSPSRDPEDSASAFLAVALSLREDILDRRAPIRRARQDDVRSAIEPLILPPEALAREKDLGAYRLVILANVARLPEASAALLARYVSGGGELLVLAGDRASPAFYNNWAGPGGAKVSPARLPEKRTIAGDPAGLALNSFSHPGIRSLIDAGRSDAASVAVSAYWRLESFGAESLAVRAALDNGCPLIAERALGKGTVVMTCVGFDGRDSNLPRSAFFVPFVHELVYHLAAGGSPNWNVRPGTAVALPQAAGIDKSLAEQVKVARIRQDKAGDETAEPALLPVAIEADENTNRVSRLAFARTDEPGLYRFVLPQPLDGVLAGTPARGKGLPFVVKPDAAESDLVPAGDGEAELIKRFLGDEGVRFDSAASAEELNSLIAVVHTTELWKYLAIGMLVILIGEVALERLIAAQRKAVCRRGVALGASAGPAAAAPAAGRRAKETHDAVGARTL